MGGGESNSMRGWKRGGRLRWISGVVECSKWRWKGIVEWSLQ